jgi:oxaloacetate decarboxylase (Na+ extruding) subunit alpha
MISPDLPGYPEVRDQRRSGRSSISQEDSGMDVQFVDTTFRDGSQSLWASGMRTGMMEAVAAIMDEVGFAAIEVPVNGIYFKKIVRDLKEDPWDLLRMLGRKMPKTTKACMAGGFIFPFEPPPPREMIELYYARVVATGAFNRAQLTSNTVDQIKRTFPWIIPIFRQLGVQIVLALSYTVSPRHTDDYYAQKTRELVAFKPDAIYVKDQGGLLTVDRVRSLLPAMIENAAGIPIELHSHCTTSLAPLVYLEALQFGVPTLHTAVPPLAQGSSQPSVLNVAHNARLMGYSTRVDERLIETAAQRLTAIAQQERLPIGAPLEYDAAQYVHQVPGGVISNLKHQLVEMRMQQRLNEVLEESVHVREDLGYPIMITPLSQFVVTQAAINVAVEERYKHVIDELILFAQGVYGEDSGYSVMDQDLKDRLLNTQRAAELASRQKPNITLRDLRMSLGGTGVSDEEFLLRYIMKGDQEIKAMRAAGRPKQYFNSALPLATLLDEAKKHQAIRYVSVKKGADSLVLQNQSADRDPGARVR